MSHYGIFYTSILINFSMNTLFKIFLIAGFIISNSIVIAQADIETLENHIENGEYNAALKLSGESLAKDTTNSLLWFKNGKINRDLQRYNEAVCSFKKAIEIDSSKVKYQLALAAVYNTSGQSNNAIKTYKNILSNNPDNIAASVNLGFLLLSKKLPEKAYPIYYNLHQTDTTNAEYVRKMAKCRELDKDWQEVIRLLEKAYRIDDSNLMVILDLTKMYIRTEQNDTALSILNKAIDQYPNSGRLYSRRGNANFGKNYHFRAIPDFEKAIELNADSKLVQKRLGISNYSIKKYEEAKEILEKLIEKDTSDYQVCLYLGQTYNGLNEPKKAIELLEKAVELIAPEKLVMSSIYTGMADSYRLAGQYHKEIEMINKRQKILPKKYKTVFYMLEIAEIYEDDLNNKKKAVQYYENFYASTEGNKWVTDEYRNKILTKINRLKEDLHFEQ